MRKEYDFSRAKRAREIPHLKRLQATVKGKTRITIMLDDDVIEAFRKRAETAGQGYQTLINLALRDYLDNPPTPLDEATLRRIIREESRFMRG
jgi:uncharacterized protein (DUF4415 family)